MEPIEWGLMAIGVLMLKKAGETASETLTKEAINSVLSHLKSKAVHFSGQLRGDVSVLGERVHNQFPAEMNPFDDPELLEAIVVEETQKPEVSQVVKEVENQLPKMEIKIDQRKQQGIVINDQGTANFNEKIEQNFS
jgi:hypothetical protein